MDFEMQQPVGDALRYESLPPLSGTLALVFTDLEGSSALSERLGDAFEVQRNAHFDVLRNSLDDYAGYEVETAGDSLFAVFPNVSKAVNWSLTVQKELRQHPWPASTGEIKIRIGVHVGVPFINRDKKSGQWTYRGPATNRTARLMGAGHGGQTLLSQDAVQLLDSRKGENQPAVFELRDLGTYRLKGIGDEKIWQVTSLGTAVDFPPLSAISSRRHNLPNLKAPFFGRAAHLEGWHDLLLQPTVRLLTLSAFGGMGKTRSALQLAENCALDFEDGVWWVGLENARGESGMLSEILEALPLDADFKSPLLDQIQRFLQDKSLLLVLDNIEQISDAPRVIKGLLEGAPQLKILVTSRHALQMQSEVVREVPPLSVGESGLFFCERALALGREYLPDDATVAAIARAVEGVPLALELSASLTGVLTPQQILARLNNQLKLLQSRSPDLPDRQRALRATMDWSCQMLDLGDREIFASLSVFVGGFELEDAEAVTGSDDIYLSVAELHRRSLLRAQSGENSESIRYAMLESVRAYAEEQLASSPEKQGAVRRRHGMHFSAKMASLASKLYSKDEAQALRLAAIDFDNVRAALRYLGNEPTAIAEFSLAYGRILQRSGFFKEAGERFQQGLDNYRNESGPKGMELNLKLERAGAHLDLFEFDRARELAEAVLEEFTGRGDERGQAECHYLFALIELRRRGSPEKAVEYLEKALPHFQGVWKAMVLNALGLCAHLQGEISTAKEHFETALHLYQNEGYERGTAQALTNLGVLAEESGDLPTAQQRYNLALQLEARSGSQSGLARALSNVGEIETLLKNWETAARILAAATLLFERAGSPLRSHSYSLLETSATALSLSPDRFLDPLREKTMAELAAVAP